MKNPQLVSNSEINLDELTLCQVTSYYKKQLKMHQEPKMNQQLDLEMVNLHGERKVNAQEELGADFKNALKAFLASNGDGSKLAKVNKLMLEDGTLPDKFIEMTERNKCEPLTWQLSSHILLIIMVIGGLIGPGIAFKISWLCNFGVAISIVLGFELVDCLLLAKISKYTKIQIKMFICLVGSAVISLICFPVAYLEFSENVFFKDFLTNIAGTCFGFVISWWYIPIGKRIITEIYGLKAKGNKNEMKKTQV